jgi:hypothetical protein
MCPGLNVQINSCRHNGDKKQDRLKLETCLWTQFRPG